MKITEMIAKLESLMKIHGDAEIFHIVGCGCCDHPGPLIPEKITYKSLNVHIDGGNKATQGVLIGDDED